MVGGAKEDLLTLRGRMEAENRNELLGRLLPELWQKIIDENLHQNDLLAFAMTCRFFRDTTKDLGKKVETNLNASRLLELRKSGKVASHTLGWFQWVCDTFEILPGFEWGDERVKGAVYEGNLLHYAAFQGSVEILRWLMEEKGWKLNYETGSWAGMGGSVEILEHLGGKGYEFDEGACSGAASEGHLEALKWLRAQNPPCPWSRSECRNIAFQFGHRHVIDWIDQQEDESDVELSDSDDDRSYDSYGDDYL